jgi:hypothetical protein
VAIAGVPNARLAVLALFAVMFLGAVVTCIVRPSGFTLIVAIFLGVQGGLLSWMALVDRRRILRAADELKKQLK